MSDRGGYVRAVGRALDVALVLLGAAAVTFGVWQVYEPSAWIVGGVIAAALGLFGSTVRVS